MLWRRYIFFDLNLFVVLVWQFAELERALVPVAVAIDSIKWKLANPSDSEKDKSSSTYHSVDPAPGIQIWSIRVWGRELYASCISLHSILVPRFNRKNEREKHS